MKVIAIIIAKITLIVGRILNRGSSLPGYIARRISPNILGQLKQPPNIVMVTGTNGKTSTTHFISSIMERASYKVAHNREGANMPQGITTVLIENSSLSGVIDADVSVLEVDEGFLKTITDEITPDYLVLTNLFEDQLDRFGNLEEVANKIKNAVPKKTKLIINANDPLLVKIGKDLIENEKIYYGVEGLELKVEKNEIKCPNCSKELNYDKLYYDKIGYYSCCCGFKTPEIDYLATDVNLAEKTFMLNGHRFTSAYGSDYFIYNILAAISYAKEMGITDTIIEKAIKDYKIGSGRMESITFGRHNTILNLVKNPAGLNRSIEYIDKNQGDDYYLLISVNNRPADGEDTTWLKSVNYQPLQADKLKTIYIFGEAVQDLRGALIESGIDTSKIEVIEDLEVTLTKLKNSQEKTYFLTNYTAMERVSKAIESM